MFFWRKRSIQAQFKVVEDQKPNAAESDEVQSFVDGIAAATAYADITKNLITHAALTIGGVYIACKIVERICK